MKIQNRSREDNYVPDPESIVIEITTSVGCSVNCVFCPQTLFVQRYYLLFGTSAPRILSYENFTTILKKLPKKCSIIFSGYVEPFQNPECTKMMLEAYKDGHPVIICTTLMGLSNENISKILENISFVGKQIMFYVHLPSIEEMEHIKVTPEYLRTLDLLLASKIPIEFR